MDIYVKPGYEHASLSRVRSIAGRKGGIARWKDVEREPTVKARLYAADVERLKRSGTTIARAVRALLEGGNVS